MTESVRKRSVTLGRHRTSISIEDPFWDALKTIAQEKNISLHTLIEAIDRDRAELEGNLSGSLRLFVLRHLQTKLQSRDIG
ncbi:MAG: ribbon-helix-helix domain-containing protein [Rhodospirillaceae bacterium]|nr:ribbon-helix-helix domain-containing protein [Rhodospirillaceae bacterium]